MVSSLAVVHLVKDNKPSSCIYQHPAVCTEIDTLTDVPAQNLLLYKEDGEPGEGKDPHWAR